VRTPKHICPRVPGTAWRRLVTAFCLSHLRGQSNWLNISKLSTSPGCRTILVCPISADCVAVAWGWFNAEKYTIFTWVKLSGGDNRTQLQHSKAISSANVHVLNERSDLWNCFYGLCRWLGASDSSDCVSELVQRSTVVCNQ